MTRPRYPRPVACRNCAAEWPHAVRWGLCGDCWRLAIVTGIGTALLDAGVRWLM